MSDRSYRAVLLRADEAAELTRASRGQKCESMRRNECCPHLDLFHNRGQRTDGSRWKHCSFFGCQCEGEDTADEPHIQMRRKTEALIAKQDRWDVARAWLLLGLAIGAIAGWLLA